MTDTNTAEREAPEDGELVAIYKRANGEDTGKAQPLTTKRIINAMRAAYKAGRASLAASAGSEPMFWVRLCSDGLYEGPIHNARIEKVRELSGAWSPLYLHPSPPEGVAGWISVEDRLPEWAARDDTPCFINGKEVPPMLTSETVLVALQGGGVRTDKLTTIEGNSAGWWHTYGERVIAWQKPPAPPLPASEAKEL